jgi:hypothetical protein
MKSRAQPRPGARNGGGHPVAEVVARIRVIHGRLAILDSDLAAFYEVPLRRLLERFERREPVPGELRFTPDDSEMPRDRWGEPCRAGVFAFTEHGCFMAAVLLNSRRAMARSVHLIRAFASRRQGPAS